MAIMTSAKALLGSAAVAVLAIAAAADFGPETNSTSAPNVTTTAPPTAEGTLKAAILAGGWIPFAILCGVSLLRIHSMHGMLSLRRDRPLGPASALCRVGTIGRLQGAATSLTPTPIAPMSRAGGVIAHILASAHQTAGRELLAAQRTHLRTNASPWSTLGRSRPTRPLPTARARLAAPPNVLLFLSAVTAPTLWWLCPSAGVVHFLSLVHQVLSAQTGARMRYAPCDFHGMGAKGCGGRPSAPPNILPFMPPCLV